MKNATSKPATSKCHMPKRKDTISSVTKSGVRAQKIKFYVLAVHDTGERGAVCAKAKTNVQLSVLPCFLLKCLLNPLD